MYAIKGVDCTDNDFFHVYFSVLEENRLPSSME